MALEDICSFKDLPVPHKRLTPASLLEGTNSAIHMTDQCNLGWRTLTSSERHGGVPLHFSIPSLPNSARFHTRLSTLVPPPTRSVTVRRPFPLSHGTTTLGFIFQGGVIAAADTRASAGGLVACPAVSKITPIHSHLVVTSSGSGADCVLWERILAREIRLYQLRYGRCLSISGAAKLLSFMLHPFKGTEVCVALTLCGWDTEVGQNVDWAAGSAGSAALKQTGTSLNDSCSAAVSNQDDTAMHSTSPNSGPKVIYVCSDGTRLQEDVISVGSGSPYAYGVLDRDLRWSLSKEEAVSLAREAVFRATHRDAYSGNNVDLFHITARGWRRRERENLKEEYYRDMEKRVKKVEERKRGTN
ncbi:proteasome subunit beta type-11a [Centroberyx affinis]|uniref:proteasome subunit beta type-11a n=1 Tax=Centroberyx affinis TaxID=166261 RepID=UPI003A5C7777